MNPEELKSIAVLRGMDTQALDRLAAALEEKTCVDGQTVFAEGDPGDSMYFIFQGNIRIEKRATAAGTTHKTLTVLQDGDYFGEMALLDHKPRSASAVAAGPARILRLSNSAFDRLQQSAGVAAMSVLFGMIRTSSDRIRRLSSQLVVYDEVGKAIGESQNLQGLLDVILQQLVSATGADWGLIVLRSQFSDQLEIRAQANLALTAAQVSAVNCGEGFLEVALRNPQDALVEGFADSDQFGSCKRLGFETPSLLLAPILVEGKLLGLIVLGGQENGQFDVNALNLARGIARQAAQAILNARHREEEQARSRHSRQYVKF